MSLWLGCAVHRYLPEHYFWACLFRVFSDKVIIWVNRLDRKHCSPQWKYTSSNPLWVWIGRKKKQRKEEIALCLTPELGYKSSALRFGFTLASLVHGPLNSDWGLHHWIPGSQAFRFWLVAARQEQWKEHLEECPCGPQNHTTSSTEGCHTLQGLSLRRHIHNPEKRCPQLDL